MNNIKIYIFNNDELSSNEKIVKCYQLYKNTKERPEIIRLNYAKPCFEKKIGVYFSVSHSKDYWACAMSDFECGLDIQYCNEKYNMKIADRFFHPLEISYLHKNNYKYFFEIWSAKESYVKYLGEGLSHDLKSFSVVSNDKISNNIDGVYLSSITFDDKYCFYISSKANLDYELIRVLNNKLL